MSTVDEVIAATFEDAKGDANCKAAVGGLRSLYEAGKWEPGEILKAITASRKSNEAN